jgi:hypothetical protein
VSGPGAACRPRTRCLSLHFKYKGFVLEVQSQVSGQQNRGGDPRFSGVSSAGTRLALSRGGCGGTPIAHGANPPRARDLTMKRPSVIASPRSLLTVTKLED